MDHKTIVDQINRESYNRNAVRSWYRDLSNCTKPERALLDRFAPSIRNKSLLDICIGGGRTTKFLLELSADYVGIDYAPDLVDVARARYPDATIHCKDARSLTMFEAGSFDFVLVSNNGLDYMVHEDRLTVLREIHRVLKPGGLFALCTHNRERRGSGQPSWRQGLRFDFNLLKNCAHDLLYCVRHLKMKKHEIQSQEYAVINDNAHGYSLLTYYISRREQIAQLASLGFGEIETYDSDGNTKESDTTSPDIHYVSRKVS